MSGVAGLNGAAGVNGLTEGDENWEYFLFAHLACGGGQAVAPKASGLLKLWHKWTMAGLAAS